MNILENLIKYNSIELFCKEIISLVNKIKDSSKSIRHKIEKNKYEIIYSNL